MLGGMATRSDELSEALGGQRLFVEVPDALADWIPACEVVVQERLAAFALGAARLEDLPTALAFFGRRARVGVHGASTPQQVADAFGAGAHFVTSPVCTPDLLDAAGGRPLVVGALTPTEVAIAAGQGAMAVQIIPADVMSTAYSRALLPLCPDVPIVATGRLERFQAEMWLDAGAAAVGLVETALKAETSQGIFPDVLDLDEARRRCQAYADLAMLN